MLPCLASAWDGLLVHRGNSCGLPRVLTGQANSQAGLPCTSTLFLIEFPSSFALLKLSRMTVQRLANLPVSRD